MMVEMTGFEPAASWSQTKHSTKLSYISISASHKTARQLYIKKSVKSTLFLKFFEFFFFFSKNLSLFWKFSLKAMRHSVAHYIEYGFQA